MSPAVTLTGGACFVAMPFRRPIDKVYEASIRPAVEQTGLYCVRGDEIYSKDYIRAVVWKAIEQASVVIGELTSSSPNVLYEVGYADALRKPVVLLASRRKHIPADLQGLRVIFRKGQSPVRLKKEIAGTLQAALEDPYCIPSQFTLPMAFEFARKHLPLIDSDDGALNSANERRSKGMSVAGYCGDKGARGYEYYLDQFEEVKRDDGFHIRRMFRGSPDSLESIEFKEKVGVLLHAEARRQFCRGVSIRWVKKHSQLGPGDGLTLFGEHLFVHKSLKQSHLTTDPPTPRQTRVVKAVQAAYDSTWRVGTDQITDSHIEELKRLVAADSNGMVRVKGTRQNVGAYLEGIKGAFEARLGPWPFLGRDHAAGSSRDE